MYRRFLIVIVSFVTIAVHSSCKKDKISGPGLFYGKWKTSYGDTVNFAWENGKNILTFDNSMNPQMPVTTKQEYRYEGNKLSIKMPDGYPAISVFRTFQSFDWVEEGKSFTIQGIEWFMFLSASSSYFTFTKIP
jgi:hypothetical protein